MSNIVKTDFKVVSFIVFFRCFLYILYTLCIVVKYKNLYNNAVCPCYVWGLWGLAFHSHVV